jgi:hypothetical protein
MIVLQPTRLMDALPGAFAPDQRNARPQRNIVSVEKPAVWGSQRTHATWAKDDAGSAFRMIGQRKEFATAA